MPNGNHPEHQSSTPHAPEQNGQQPSQEMMLDMPVQYQQPYKKKKSGFVRFLNFIMSMIMLVVIGGIGVFFYGKYLIDQPGTLKKSRIVSIPKGQGLSRIASRLERYKVIDNKYIFIAAVRAHNVQNKLRAGEYQFKKHASYKDVMDVLTKGKSFLYKLTMPEGWTSYMIVQRINAHEQLRGAPVTAIPAEGSLMPDTYFFGSTMTKQDIINKMQSTQSSFLEKAWAKRQDGLPVKTPQEAVTLASVVEKETGIASERFHIAGVFTNRLRKNMRLQSDPTIIYGINKGRGKLGRGLRRSEIRKKTQWNTYQINGLPITPIANPGRAAIEAVLNPAKTDDLFFVADGTGGHVFAKTNREHVNNVKTWRKIEKAKRARQKLAKIQAEKDKKAALKAAKAEAAKAVKVAQ